MLENELEDEQDRTQVGPTPLNMFFFVSVVSHIPIASSMRSDEFRPWVRILHLLECGLNHTPAL